MKIYDLNLTGGSGTAQSGRTQQTQQTEQTGGVRGSGSASAGSSDRVEFSNALGRLSQVLAADGSARADRVASLAAQYQSGNYHPDSAATSRAMVSELLAAGH